LAREQKAGRTKRRRLGWWLGGGVVALVFLYLILGPILTVVGFFYLMKTGRSDLAWHLLSRQTREELPQDSLGRLGDLLFASLTGGDGGLMAEVAPTSATSLSRILRQRTRLVGVRERLEDGGVVVVVTVETLDLRDLLQLSLKEVIGQLLTGGKVEAPSHQELVALAGQAELVRRTISIPVRLEGGWWRMDLSEQAATVGPWLERLKRLRGR